MEENQANELQSAEPEMELERPRELGEGRSFFSRALRVLLWLTLSVILGTALGVVGYYGIPLLYHGFTEPSAITAERLEALEDELETALSQAQDLNQATQDRLEAVESALEAQAAAVAELSGQLESLADMQDESQERSEAISGLEAQLERQQSALAGLERRVAAVEQRASGEGDPWDRAQRDLLLTQAMLAIMRARLWLVENNLAAATAEVERAQALVGQAANLAPAEQTAAIMAVADRLELTLKDLGSTPLVAGDDLEIAWTLLAEELAGQTEEQQSGP